jgi:hypothetical protein
MMANLFSKFLIIILLFVLGAGEMCFAEAGPVCPNYPFHFWWQLTQLLDDPSWEEYTDRENVFRRSQPAIPSQYLDRRYIHKEYAHAEGRRAGADPPGSAQAVRQQYLDPARYWPGPQGQSQQSGQTHVLPWVAAGCGVGSLVLSVTVCVVGVTKRFNTQALKVDNNAAVVDVLARLHTEPSVGPGAGATSGKKNSAMYDEVYSIAMIRINEMLIKCDDLEAKHRCLVKEVAEKDEEILHLRRKLSEQAAFAFLKRSN